MKRGRWVLVFLLGCGVLAAVGWYTFADHQPYYKGRSLTTWVTLYEKASLHFPADPEPAEALRQIGPRAIPCLMQWVRYERPAWQYKLLATLNKVPFPLHTYSTNFSKFVENNWKQREGRHIASLWVFGVLGPVARPAARELGWLAMNRRGAVSDRAARALMDMGTNAEPAIPAIVTAAVFSTQERTSSRAVWLLGELNIPPEIAVAPLLTALKNPRPSVRLNAVKSLGKLQAATPAIPALLKMLKDPDNTIRTETEKTLMRLPDYAVPKLADKLAPPDFRSNSEAIQALANFGEHARPAVPALLRLVEEAPGYGPLVTNALRSIAPELVRPDFNPTVLYWEEAKRVGVSK